MARWSFSELKLLLPKTCEAHFRAGEVLFREGDPGDKVLLIRRGLVEIYSESCGVRRRLSLRGRGEVIGEMAILDSLGRSATAMARTDVVIRTLDRAIFEELLDQRPALVRRLTQQLSGRIRELQNTLLGELDRNEKAWAQGHMKLVGPYRLLDELGKGGMGIIYRAVHQRSQQERAVKVLPVPTEEHKARFTRECEMMARLVHPNIVRIEEGGLDGSYGYLAMELLQGENLEQRLERGPLLPREVRRWFVPCMEALAHAHERGVMHRDIKPGNLFLTWDGVLKVLDFGIARRLSGPELTIAGRFFGSPHYLAPERIGGQTRSQERQSDQYSLGVTMYQALTGSLPFTSDDVADIFAAHLHREPVPPSRLVAMSRGLESLILRMLEKDPLRRFPNLQAAVEAVQLLDEGRSEKSVSATQDFTTT